MKEYNFFLNKFIKKKYKDSTIFKLSLIKNFVYHRDYFIKYINKKKFFNIIKNNDTTYENNFQIFKNKYSKNFDQQTLEFYRKFEINLSLKKNYDLNFIKKNNIETSSCTYMYLAMNINSSRFLNKFQKINCMLKIIDKILSKKQYVESCNFIHLTKLINLERKLLSSVNEK